MKYNKENTYKYDVEKYKGWGGPMEPQNIPLPHSETDKTRIIHYGRISPRQLSGEKHEYVATINQHVDGMNYEQRLKHHQEAANENTLKLGKIKEEWIWKS